MHACDRSNIMSHARSNCTRVLGKQRTRHARRRSARPPARKTWPGGAAARFLAWRPGVRGVNARTSIKKMHTMQNCAQVSMQLLARRAQQAAGAPATPGAAHAARAHRPARASRPAGRIGLRKMLQRTCVHTCKSNMTRRMHYIKHCTHAPSVCAYIPSGMLSPDAGSLIL